MPFQIIRNDIANVKADAIVNTANPRVAYGQGVDRTIYEKAGKEQLLAAREQIGEIRPGDVAHTAAFGLEAKYILHVVGPAWRGGRYKEVEILRKCYDNCLQLAKKLDCESIACPLIATGSYGFPKEKAIEIAIAAITDFLCQEEMQIILVVFDRESLIVSGHFFDGIREFIDQNYVDAKIKAEYPRRQSRFQPSVKDRGSEYGQRTLPQREKSEWKREGNFSEELPSFDAGIVSELKISEPVIQEELSLAANSEKLTLENILQTKSENFQARLLSLIDQKEMTDVEVYKKANLDRKLFSKIRCNPDYRPTKKTAIALAVALELNLEETKDLLSRAELALSPGSIFDLIISYCIQNHVYDIYSINMALFQYEQPLLG